MRKKPFLLMAVLGMALLVPAGAGAREEFSEKTGKGCSFCHASATGGPLGEVGIAYARNHYEYPIPKSVLERSHVLGSPLHRSLRFLSGYIHLLAASILVGTIFYVHVFIRPGSLSGGVPRGERRLGLSCMATLLATGIYLTWYRIDSPSGFLRSHFGLILLVKIVLFALMITSGILAVTVVSRLMRREAAGKGGKGEGAAPGDERFTLTFEGKVYDVTGSDKWKDGKHFRKHEAGTDLTGALEGAPHGREVLEKVPLVGDAGKDEEEGGAPPVRKVFVVMAWTNMVLVFLILLCVTSWTWGIPLDVEASGMQSAGRSDEESCVECHRTSLEGIYHDWRGSVHALVGVTCLDCHESREPGYEWVSAAHLEHSPVPVSPLVTPARCAGCHPAEAEEYSASKHANTLEIIEKIDKWMIFGLNNEVERSTGCYACHGTVVRFEDGTPSAGTWPNVGVGRANPDGTLGSCTSCHTRHSFSIVEARKPEACDQCHLGPDHPQIEIYNESKHGTIYHAESDGWTWRPDDSEWTAGRDYRAPTCAACHMSEAGAAPRTHDVTHRLSWELQAPLTIRPADFGAFPAGTDWREERAAMESICLQCHSEGWTRGHFENLDGVIANYNENYFEPVDEALGRLYERGLVSRDDYFDERVEWEYYEFWHHEGRRARMGAAMMAPDYAWWHGFYELKRRYPVLMREIEEIERSGRPAPRYDFPGKLE